MGVEAFVANAPSQTFIWFSGLQMRRKETITGILLSFNKKILFHFIIYDVYIHILFKEHF